jgi:hypothetical protein
VPGICKSSPESENRVCTPSLLRQPRKKRLKRRKEPVWRSSTGAWGLPRRRSGGLRWHPSQICRTWLPPQKLSSPSPSLYMAMGMVMIREKEDPDRRRDGREHVERKCDKARRCSRLVRPLGDRRRDMLRLHPAAASRSPRAPGPRPACAGRSPRAALAENTAPGSLLRQHFLHYFSEEISTAERGIRTAENTPSPTLTE